MIELMLSELDGGQVCLLFFVGGVFGLIALNLIACAFVDIAEAKHPERKEPDDIT